MKSLVLFFICFLLFSCSPKQLSENNAEIKNDNGPKDFNYVYEDFFKTVSRGDRDGFNKYIHPVHGLYIIESPGALPSIVNVKDIAVFSPHYNDKSFFVFDRSTVTTKFNHEELPLIDCDNFPDFWTKKGVFVKEENRLSKGNFWEFLDVSEKEKVEVKNLVATIDVTVVNTSNYTWCFSMINMKWYITFIDMREPCSA
ncbi:MAG: hypothetical protein H0V01_05105 [Bacteroidetes bacterium]|nr:hypothetical protein [Bacteroidota bacterium]HET6244795.1 hypothetical protein [Bacteroidia bacterium]